MKKESINKRLISTEEEELDIVMNLEELLDEALRQWNDFIIDRSDCTYKDYNDFILEIYNQKEGEVKL